MTPTSRLAAIISVGFLALLGCSKTQDTAPETRVFGDPPVIQAATTTVDPAAVATCDFTNWYLASRGLCDDYPIVQGSITIESRYTEVLIEATVTDPNDPAPPSTATDVLLVSASYVTDDSTGGAPKEDTLVLFDDGSQVTFPFGQKDNGLEACTAPMNNRCNCTKAFYDVTSNDPTVEDDRYTRAFAFAPGTNIPDAFSGLYLDCIAKDRGQASQISADLNTRTTPLEFRIEAVDRSGNLTESPVRPTASIGQGAISCTGDPCACCLLFKDPLVAGQPAPIGCFGLDGLMFEPNTPKRCEPSAVVSRDPARFGVLCTTNAECCSPGKCCGTDAQCGGTGKADYAEGSCIQSQFSRRCSTGFCKNTACLRP